MVGNSGSSNSLASLSVSFGVSKTHELIAGFFYFRTFLLLLFPGRINYYSEKMIDIVYLVISGAAGLVLGVIITATMLRKAVEKKSEKLLNEAKEKAEVYKKDKYPHVF